MKLTHIQIGFLISLTLLVCTTGFSYLIFNQTLEKNLFSDEDEKIEPSASRSGSVSVINFDPLPFSLGIGSIVSLIAMASWIGSSRIKVDAVSLMLDNGLGDMTLNDLEIVKHMMSSEKFTVPELTGKTNFSRQTVWRQVNKMIEEELVKETGEKKLPKSGRGKPSKVFRFIEPKTIQ